jgi:hypothetical protein
VMNPKPLESLNHFTVPVDIVVIPFLSCMCADQSETRFRARCSREELDCHQAPLVEAAERDCEFTA